VTTAQPARFPWARYLVILAIILVVGAGPIISVMISSAIANANGCNLNEGGVDTCMVAGMDLGGTLYELFVMGWLGLITVPLGLGGLLVWTVRVIIHRIAWGRQQRGTRP